MHFAQYNLYDNPDNREYIERDFERYTGRKVDECMAQVFNLLARMQKDPLRIRARFPCLFTALK